jgi:uncharacterized membrane protein YdbT with pleckstrin-like domain
MNYTDKILSMNEKILMKNHKHFFVILLIAAVVFAVLKYNEVSNSFILYGLLAIVIIDVLSMSFDIMRWNNEIYIVTTRRVIHASGVLNKKVMDSSLSKINDLILEQSLLGRIFNYGTIKIITAADEVINSLEHISKPLEFKQAMLNAKAEMEPIGSPTIPSTTAADMMDQLEQLRTRKMITDAEYEAKRKEILARM